MPLCLIEASYINNIMSDRLVDLFWYHRKTTPKIQSCFLGIIFHYHHHDYVFRLV